MRPRAPTCFLPGAGRPAPPSRRRGRTRARVILPVAALGLFALVIPFHRSAPPVATGGSRSVLDSRARSGFSAGESGLRPGAAPKSRLPGPQGEGKPQILELPRDEGRWLGSGLGQDLAPEAGFRPRENGGLRSRGLGETSFARAHFLTERGSWLQGNGMSKELAADPGTLGDLSELPGSPGRRPALER